MLCEYLHHQPKCRVNVTMLALRSPSNKVRQHFVYRTVRYIQAVDRQDYGTFRGHWEELHIEHKPYIPRLYDYTVRAHLHHGCCQIVCHAQQLRIADTTSDALVHQ